MRLSSREAEVLSYISLCVELLGHPPTQMEIARRLGTKSRGFVGRILTNLEDKGLIRMHLYKIRGIELIKQLEAA